MNKLRFKGFTTRWHQATFKDILNYEQPTKYRIKAHEVQSKGKIPVLTANKSFILGYTNENHPYTKGQCIIFDDFTLDTKFVDFPFMVKSSAIKILTAKHSNIYFDYKLLKHATHSHLLNDKLHKRHYISMVQSFKINIPDLKEQDKIGKLFRTYDKLIKIEQKKILMRKKLEKGYIQHIFN